MDEPLCFLSTLFAMFILVTLVMMRLALARKKGIETKEVSENFYKLYNQGDESVAAIQARRNLANLFEIPVLFYVVVLLIFVTHKIDPMLHFLAWGYVGLRYLHSLIHLTINHVMARFAAWGFSNVVLVVMWVRWYLMMRQ